MKTKQHNQEEPIFAGKTLSELEALSAEFDREFIADEFEPLTPEQQARWERAKRRGKPEASEVEHVTVDLDRDLLRRADEVAQRLGATRDDVVARGLRAVLAVEGEG